MLALLAVLALAEIPRVAPPPIALSSDEQYLVQSGQIATRIVPTDRGAEVTGIVDVAAPADRVWAAILDVPARVGEIKGLKEAEIYHRAASPEQLGVRWLVQVLMSRVEFHVLYEVDRAAGWCRFRLDGTRENDLADVQGAYQVYDAGGKSRIVYRSFTDSGRNVPEVLRNWLATDSLREQLDGIRVRAVR
jgi:hypothetical protein